MTLKELKITYLATASLVPYVGNARRHSKRQIQQIADGIRTNNFNNPIAIARDLQVIAGHGRLEAAKLLGLERVPTICLDHLSEAQRKAYALADNKLALNATWDLDLLAAELASLGDLGYDLELTGFSTTEIDLTLEHARDANPSREESRGGDSIPLLRDQNVTRRCEVWMLGRHMLLCGDARAPQHYEVVLNGQTANVVFCDPPYNVAVKGHVSGLGKIKHDEFAMASGEMTDDEFTAFLTTCMLAIAASCKDGAIVFTCIDWRGMDKLLEAGKRAFTELKQLCVWRKTNAGMGTFYRSRHELVFVYKVGTAAHTNNFGLGDTGRYRTNVWDYPGISSLGGKRAEEQARHPTPKPVAMVADAIRDCSRRNEIVLDPFGGSGSTLIAAEICGRSARLIEYEPKYCDVIVRRYEEFTGKQAVLKSTGQTFEEVAGERLSPDPKVANG